MVFSIAEAEARCQEDKGGSQWIWRSLWKDTRRKVGLTKEKKIFSYPNCPIDVPHRYCDYWEPPKMCEQTSPFFSLPVDVRRMVYAHIFTDRDLYVVVQHLHKGKNIFSSRDSFSNAFREFHKQRLYYEVPTLDDRVVQSTNSFYASQWMCMESYKPYLRNHPWVHRKSEAHKTATLRTCWRLYLDCQPLLYTSNKFVFRSFSSFSEFVHQFPPRPFRFDPASTASFNLIRFLDLNYTPAFFFDRPYVAWLQLARMVNLETLKIWILLRNLDEFLNESQLVFAEGLQGMLTYKNRNQSQTHLLREVSVMADECLCRKLKNHFDGKKKFWPVRPFVIWWTPVAFKGQVVTWANNGTVA